jgi:hypothetical protein
VTVLAIAALGGPGPTRLTETVQPQGSDGPETARIIDCVPPGAPEPECDRLESLSRHAFRRKTGRARTQIYGGPAQARVEGRLDGEDLATSFSLRNGCEIARWRRFTWLLGAIP